MTRNITIAILACITFLILFIKPLNKTPNKPADTWAENTPVTNKSFQNESVNNNSIDTVRILKQARKLQLIANNQVQQEFHIALGANPIGHKQQEGDERTPEGRYTLDYKKADSAFYKAFHISYPNSQDTDVARNAGVSPGGFIMIHGQKNGLGWLASLSQRFDWTNGCIALSNADMDIVWQKVNAGTPIELRP